MDDTGYNTINTDLFSKDRHIATFDFGKHTYYAELVHLWSPDREEVEQFTHDIYSLRYRADINKFLPTMIAIRHSQSNQIVASAGFQSAQNKGTKNRLYLENYLDIPIEKSASAVGNKRFKRSDFVEVGNLAGAISGAGYLVILTLAEYLTKQGHNWIAFTLTRGMVKAFESLNLEPIPLVPASESRLVKDSASWGHYFNAMPEVMIGDMKSAYEQMEKMGLYKRIYYQNHQQFLEQQA